MCGASIVVFVTAATDDGPASLVVQNSATDPPGRLGGWLSDAGVRPVVVRPYAGEPLPRDLGEYAALVVLGGPGAVYDDGPIAGRESWLPQLRDLLGLAVGADVPTVGICLGAQLLATALGGRVRPCAAGPEVGAGLVAKRDAATADLLFGNLPLTPDVLHWHDDEIVELPPAAVLLAASSRCEHQAFRVGRRAWGMQFHIETTDEVVREWARADRRRLAARGIDADAAAERAVARHADIAETWAPVVRRFARLAVDDTE